jgi:hypothetical protein
VLQQHPKPALWREVHAIVQGAQQLQNRRGGVAQGDN